MSESYTVKEMGYTFNVMKDANMLSCDCIAVCRSKDYAELICKSLNANSGDTAQGGTENQQKARLLLDLHDRLDDPDDNVTAEELQTVLKMAAEALEEGR